MITRIVYPSALEYWLNEKGIPYRYWDAGKPAQGGEKKSGRAGITETVKRLNFTAPVHVAVPKGTCWKRTTAIIYHMIPKGFPEGSFIRMADDVMISSPEMCFLQAACVLPLHQLVKLACNLCAIYVLDPYEEYGQRNREPITTVSNITDYLQKAKGLKGVHLAKQAIQYAYDRANSPKEVDLVTIAALPIHDGGYGLTKMRLNYDVRLSEKGADHLGRETCCCDFVWLEKKVVLEYDSNLSHLSREQHARDKARVTALSLSGYKVISATAEDVLTYGKIEDLFRLIRHTLGERAYTSRLQEYSEKRRAVVMDIMFSENKCY